MKSQRLSGLFSIKLDNDDIQDFDLRWEQALLITSDSPPDKVLGGLYVSKLQDSSQAQTIMALYNQEIVRGGEKRDYHRLRMCVGSCTMSKLKEVKTSGFRAILQSVWP